MPKYVSLFAGYTSTGSVDGDVQTGGLDIQYQDGWPKNGAFGFANGRYINDKWRMEGEWAYRRAEVADPYNGDIGSRVRDGALNVYSWTFNIYRDFGCARLRPYLGAGGGFNLQDFHVVDTQPSVAFPNQTNAAVRTWGLGYQGIIGLSYQTARCNNLFVEYRYYGTSDTKLYRVNNSEVGGTGNVTTNSVNDTFNIDQNMIVFGLRINR